MRISTYLLKWSANGLAHHAIASDEIAAGMIARGLSSRFRVEMKQYHEAIPSAYGGSLCYCGEQLGSDVHKF